ncbi:MAG TPA: 5'/3'-nucleotidase SurE [Gemmatimonadales bacterium]|nr:5'/3'-nucleotidase SurE [Gemmatimonadales bacterium]
MRILVSNDDGILARGLALLADVCRTVGEVTVVAPDREQSGTSHSLTLTRPLRPVRRPDGAYQVDGTPTDCVLLALGTLMPARPEFVFSGINHGPNMGEDVLYSGTVAAAMEGLSLGIPGVAISFAGSDLDLMDSHRQWLERLVAGIVRVRDFPRETLLNVNLPPIAGDQVRGIKVTTLGSRVFSESLMETRDPWGRHMYWIGGGQISWSGSQDSDFMAVRDGFISVTPLHVDLTNYRLLEDVRSWKLGG